MQNFNTNQTRFLYVADAINANVENNLDIALSQTVTGEMFFKYKNADGLVTRSDSFDPKKIVSLKKTTAAEMAKPLMAHTITINTDEFANVSALVDKTVKLNITIHQVFDYDDSNAVTFTVSYKVPTGATAANFYAALKSAIELAMPKPDKSFPYFTVTSTANGLVITEAPQKYVRGKLSGEPVHFSVSFGMAASSYQDDELVAWGKDAVAASGQTISGSYTLADLEYFAAGEKGDYVRGSTWPNNYEFTPAIDLSKSYDVLSIEYYWAGGAENVQKSPRMIQVAGKAADITTLYNTVNGATLEGRVEALENA